MKLSAYLPSLRELVAHVCKSVAVIALVLVALAALGALSACGGGDPDDQADGVKTIDPPACTTSPEVCK